jgi:hypothetical protein
MPRLLVVLAWLLAGHAALGGLAWAFINIPESNTLMVILSAAVVLVFVAAAAWIETVALLAWDPGLSGRDRWWRGGSAIVVFVFAAVLFVAFWLATTAGYEWLDRYRGEIDAWLIARFKTADTGWLHRTARALLFSLRWIVGLAVATTLLAFGIRGGLTRLVRLRWLRAAITPRTIGATGLAFVVLIAMPLHYVDARPSGLPPTWVEPAFVAAKLGLLFVVVNAGWALVLHAAAVAEERDRRRAGSNGSSSLLGP